MGALMGSGSNVRYKYFESEVIQIRALVSMVQVAKDLGAEKGVAFVLVKKKLYDTGDIRFRIVNNVMIRRPSNNELQDGKMGTNYFGVAMGKLAVMMDTDTNSGSSKYFLRTGEMPYRGGLIRFEKEYRIYVGFSGGTEDEDVVIARAGMMMLFPK